jgi:hypothetical protein
MKWFAIPLNSITHAVYGLPADYHPRVGPDYRMSVLGTTPLLGGLRAKESKDENGIGTSTAC